MIDQKSPFYTFINLLKFFGILTIIGSILLLVYIPYQDSLNKAITDSFKPIPPSAVKASKGEFTYENPNKIVNGIHVNTGMAYDKNFRIVKAVCTRCHSAKLVTQMKATREGWKEMITWMQQTQGLEDLGEFEKPILDYLSKHYAPKKLGRRSNIEIKETEWYVLNLGE